MNLGRLWTIFRRETAAYFNSAIAYIFIIVFVLLNGGLFMTQFFLFGRADMRPFFAALPLFLSIFLPAVTMRLWAEERKGNTLELLLTFPMKTEELVLGKFLASLLFYMAALAGTLSIPLMMRFLGNPDLGATAGAYLGSIFLGAFFLAVGIFVSGLCRDQIVAFILGMMICFSLHLIGTEFVASSIDGWIPGIGTLLRNFVGTERHFDSFAKGVIDGRDVFYFMSGTLIFLVLNGFWLEGRMRPKAKAIFTTAVAISAGIFLFGNWLFAGIPLGRFDLTEGQIYTIAPATKKILRDLKAPVTAKLYISPVEKMPTGMKTLEQDIKDKLDELRIAARGNFQYKIFHMEAANVTEGGKAGGEESLEQQLSGKGIRPFQVQSIEADEVGVRLVYSSITLAYKEKPEQIIPRVLPDNIHELEYLLASRIYRMNLPSNPKIALVAPYNEKEIEPALKEILAQLGGQIPGAYREDNYELLPLALGYAGYESARIKLTEKEPLPEGTTTLVVVEPLELNERQKYEINRFLRGGGSVLLAVQNYEYLYQPSGDQLQIETQQKRPEVNSLLANFGLEVDEEILVDQQHDVINLSGAARIGPFEVAVPVKVPIQIAIAASGMNPDVSITSRLSALFYLWGTAIKINPEKTKSLNLKITNLLHSTKDSWAVPFRAGHLTPDNLKPQPESRRGPFPLAVMVEGQFPDAYEGKPVPSWPAPETAEAEAKSVESAPASSVVPKPGKLILVGAASFFQKHLVRSGGHLNLFLNSVDALTLGEELVTIRSKQPIDRSIGRVSAAAKVGWRFFVTLLIPFLIAAAGFFRMFLRSQSKQNYLKVLAVAE